MVEYAIDWEIRAHDTLRANGMEIYSLSDAELARWKELLVPLIDQWAEDMDAKGLPGSEAVEIARKLRIYEK